MIKSFVLIFVATYKALTDVSIKQNPHCDHNNNNAQ